MSILLTSSTNLCKIITCICNTANKDDANETTVIALNSSLQSFLLSASALISLRNKTINFPHTKLLPQTNRTSVLSEDTRSPLSTNPTILFLLNTFAPETLIFFHLLFLWNEISNFSIPLSTFSVYLLIIKGLLQSAVRISIPSLWLNLQEEMIKCSSFPYRA